MIDSKQVRVARALLDWTQETLSEKSGVARATIKNVENGNTLPRLETANALQKTFEEDGLEFLASSGARFKDWMIQTYEGEIAAKLLLDSVYETLKNSAEKEVLIAHVNETIFINHVSREVLNKHLDRLAKAGIKERMLVSKDEKNLIAPMESYRFLPEEYHAPYPFYIYGAKLALVTWQPPRKVIIIHDERFADAARKLFNFIWDRTESPAYEHLKQKKGEFGDR